MQVVAIPALLVGNEAWIGYGLILILVGYGIVLWHAPSRAKAMAQVASQLGMRFEPIMSRAQLGIKGTTFDVGYPGENCMRGMIAGRDTLIFDKTMLIEPVARPSEDNPTTEQTIVGFRVSADTPCRDHGILQPSDWHVEKMGEWVFVYGKGGLTKPRKIPAYVEEARGWFAKSIDPKS
jgi:hypothetical protein